MLILDEFFLAVKDEDYSIIKANGFPEYKKGADVDIYCRDTASFARILLRIGNRYVTEGYEIEVSALSGRPQTYVDFYRNDLLDFRFDLYGRIPDFKHINLKGEFFNRVLEHSITVPRRFGRSTFPVRYPAEAHELVIRYVEYKEYYPGQPGKIKHREYITSRINSGGVRSAFLNLLHEFTSIPATLPHGQGMFRQTVKLAKSFLRKMKTSGFVPYWLLKNSLAQRIYFRSKSMLGRGNTA